MKRLEQAQLFLRKASQDEALVDEVLHSENVADEVIGFHCQQAAEKMLKALLSSAGIAFPKTHDLTSLMNGLSHAGYAVPKEFELLESLTPFGSVFRYELYQSDSDFDRGNARTLVRDLRAWVEAQIVATNP